VTSPVVLPAASRTQQVRDHQGRLSSRQGAGEETTLYFQGILADRDSRAEVPLSITNGVVVRIPSPALPFTSRTSNGPEPDPVPTQPARQATSARASSGSVKTRHRRPVVEGIEVDVVQGCADVEHEGDGREYYRGDAVDRASGAQGAVAQPVVTGLEEDPIGDPGASLEPEEVPHDPGPGVGGRVHHHPRALDRRRRDLLDGEDPELEEAVGASPGAGTVTATEPGTDTETDPEPEPDPRPCRIPLAARSPHPSSAPRPRRERHAC